MITKTYIKSAKKTTSFMEENYIKGGFYYGTK